MNALVCLDPAVSRRGAVGLAVFFDEVLQSATTFRPYGNSAQEILSTGIHCATIASELITRSETPRCAVASVDIVVEVPEVYKGSRVNPNPLLSLAALNGAFSSALFLRLARLVSVHGYKPREWKGSLDGLVMAKRIEERLTPDERHHLDSACLDSLRHNMLDAVGLGLFHSGRLNRARAYRR